jgi:hypothetical protein
MRTMTKFNLSVLQLEALNEAQTILEDFRKGFMEVTPIDGADELDGYHADEMLAMEGENGEI